MFSNLENAIIFTAAVWGAVKLIKHFVPDYYARSVNERQMAANALENRLATIEAKLEAK